MDRIEALIGAWTADRRASGSCAAAAHVAAPVLGVPELHDDPQVVHRGYWVPQDHPVYGPVPYSGMQAILSRTPGTVPGPAPCLGQDTWYVLESILGVDGDTIGLLLADNVLEITG
jgi:crotonobetainyl-CoA:carnitine CoA-transferase CaiB-like acyl-CoA transferase